MDKRISLFINHLVSDDVSVEFSKLERFASKCKNQYHLLDYLRKKSVEAYGTYEFLTLFKLAYESFAQDTQRKPTGKEVGLMKNFKHNVCKK